jgi:hypothetical protein
MNFRSSTLIARIGGLMLSLAAASVGAQAPDPDAAHSMQTQDTAQMQQELSTLRDQVRQLEQRMQFAVPSAMQQGGKMGSMKAQNAPSMAQVAKPAMPMGGMRKMDDDDDTEMPMKDTKSGSSKSMPSGGMGMEMNMMKMMEMMRPKMSDGAMMGMGAMGGANSPAAMATPSALPGFPGQSHLYHIGATGFFLDHPEHIALATPQQQALAQRKQQSLIKQAEVQRQIDAAEQELWQLTAADQPQIGDIEKKVREIERLRSDQRMAFIRAVGEAAKSLTDEQRKQLTGMAPAQSTAEPAPMPMPDSNNPKPDKMGHM